MTSCFSCVAMFAAIAFQLGCCDLVYSAPPGVSQTPRAFRLGPGSHSAPRARMVLVRQADSPSPPPPPGMTEQQAAGGSLADGEARWQQQVVQPLVANRLSNAIALAEARVTSYQQRLASIERFNFYAPPFSDQFSPSWVLPPAPGIRPVTTQAPVQLFSPSSTFAHSLDTAQRRLAAAELELESLQARRDSQETLVEPIPAPSLAGMEARIDVIAADMKHSQFELDSLSQRLAQSRQLSALTYSAAFSEFSEEIRLAHLEVQLRVTELEQELRLLNEHRETARQLDSVSERLARQPVPSGKSSQGVVQHEEKNARISIAPDLK